MLHLTTAAICLIACHGGPADHFSTFAQELSKHGYQVQVYGSGPALKKFQDRHIEAIPFNIDELDQSGKEEMAKLLAKSCQNAALVITDLGHPFDVSIQKSLKEIVPNVTRIAYYDNPEPFVKGGYSQVAAQVMELANKVLFANSTLAKQAIYQDSNVEIDLSYEQRIGLGYYPILQAEALAKKREELKLEKRGQFLQSQQINDCGQKIWVYLGGNNEEYFESAFPAFIEQLNQSVDQKDLSDAIIVLQQHPGAKVKNRDGILFEKCRKEVAKSSNSPKLIVSSLSTDDILVFVDGAFYYQTSMGPLMALAHIPTLQIAHETYSDVLVRNHLCGSVTNANDFMNQLDQLSEKKSENLSMLYQSLGINDQWFNVLENQLDQNGVQPL